MKKVFLILVIISLAFSIFAVNNQKIHPIGNPIYEAITALYLSTGYALPSTAGPYSSDELLKMVEKVDYNKLNGASKKIYDFVFAQLKEEPKIFKFGLEAALEAYIHTDSINFTNREFWVADTDARKPIIDFSLETTLLDSFYGYTSIPVNGRRYNQFSKTTGHTSDYFGKYPFTTNLFFLYGSGIGDLDFGMPYRAFGSFGGSGWSVQIGRDKLSWGPGKSGNFMLGEHLRYHNTGRLSIYTKSFKYSFVTSFFAHPDDYYPIMDGNDFLSHNQTMPMEGLKMFLAHRLEWRLFKNRVGLAISEAIVYQSKENTFDLRILSPTMIFHNYYIRSNANSLLTLEIDYTPIRFLNIYGQIAVDEFTLPGENVPGVTTSADPPAFGYMLGVKTAVPASQGMFYGSLEFAYTDPFLYLRDAGERKALDYNTPGVTFIVANREYSGPGLAEGLTFQEEFLGYKYGPDAIVINLNGGFKRLGKWYAEGNAFFMLHGTHDKWTFWSLVYKNPAIDKPPANLTTPTYTHWTKNYGDPDAKDRNAVSKTLVLGLKGGYTIISNLDVYAQGDFITIVNPGNIKENGTIRDFQLSIGFSYKL
ncbi:MAG: hypothetical protein WCY53_00825 [Sphaerochaetaceae bacterium]